LTLTFSLFLVTWVATHPQGGWIPAGIALSSGICDRGKVRPELGC
jgi:hypothetical protein